MSPDELAGVLPVLTYPTPPDDEDQHSTRPPEPGFDPLDRSAAMSAAGELAMLAVQFDAIEDPDAMLQLIASRGRHLIADSGFAALRHRPYASWATLGASDIASHRYADLHAAFNTNFSIALGASGDAGQSYSTSVEVRLVQGDAQLGRHGVKSILIAPIATQRSGYGTFNWYLHEDPHPGEVDKACWFARHASVAYLHARERRGLVEAASSRGIIGQAQGILMVTLDLDAAQASEVLRRLSHDSNVDLRRLAAKVIDHGSLPPETTHADTDRWGGARPTGTL